MKSKNNSVQNSVWLHVVSDKSENFPTSFFFLKRSLPFLTEIAISKKQTTAMCTQEEPRGPDHEVTLTELLQRRYGLNALVPPAMETEPS